MSMESNASPGGEQENKGWSIELGFYPGILFGLRSYDMGNYEAHVLYLPLVDIAYYRYK